MWWRQIQFRLTLVYGIIALTLLVISIMGQLRLLDEVGKTFGGFFWAIDTDGRVVAVSTAPQQQPFGISAGSVISVDHIVSAQVRGGDWYSGSDALSGACEHARPDGTISCGIEGGVGPVRDIEG